MKHHQAQQGSSSQWGKVPTKYSIWVVLATVLLVIFATIGGKISIFVVTIISF